MAQKQLIEWIPPQWRRRGRPKLTCEEGVQRAMKNRNLQKEDWRDRLRWKLGCDKQL